MPSKWWSQQSYRRNFEQSDVVVTGEGELIVPEERETGDDPQEAESFVNGHHFDEQDPDFEEAAEEGESLDVDFEMEAETDATLNEEDENNEDKTEPGDGEEDDENDESKPA